MSRGLWITISGILTVSVVVLLIAAAHVKCPHGQHLTVITYIPIVVGKVVTESPVYACR